MKKRTAALILLIALCALAMTAYAQGEKRMFTDSLGREVEIDAEITRIAVTGPLGQIVVFAIAPDLMVGIPNEWDPEAKEFLDEVYYNLPVLGQVYGGKGEMNLEELLMAGPQVVIDVGEPKEGVVQDLDALSEQTGIPFVHVSAYIDSMDETYLMLGELLGRPQEGRVLADYCRRTYDRTVSLMDGVTRVSMIYVTGEKGLNVLARGSFHSAVIDMMADNAAVVDHPISKGTGNEVDMEQMLLWNPEVIVFSDESIYDTVADDPLWQSMDAIASGRYYEVPVGPYNWLNTPPSVQRLLGMMWLGTLLYPDAVDYDLYEETALYYELFYHCELTRPQFDALMAKSLSR